MSHYEANLELLRKSSEELALRIENHHAQVGIPTTQANFAVEPARNGMPTIRVSDEEGSFYLHSPYDPEKEGKTLADKTLAENKHEANFALFFGMGLGYSVRETVKQLPDDTIVFVFEPHWDLFYLAFCHTDLSWLLTRAGTTISCDPSVQGAMLKYMNLFELAGFKGLMLFTNPVFERLPGKEHFDELAGRVRYEMLAVSGNVQTLMIMGEMQQTNIILNFPQILDNPPFVHLIDRFKNKPAVIVSAGPSLEKNMHLLKELEDRALVIAVDTATRPLLEAGIKPHVVVTGDPQEANARHLRNVSAPDTYLIAEPQSPITSVRDWDGPKFICTFHDNMMQWIDRVIGNRGRVLVWGSVAVMAYDVAVKVGADPIVFVGQDLSFPGGRTYTKGTYFETEEKMKMTTEELAEKGTTLIDMTDIYGETVQTNKQMFSYFNFLINRFNAGEAKDRMIINATEGGILKSPRVNVMTLREAIDNHMSKPHDIWGDLRRAHREGNPIQYTNLLNEMDSMLSSLRESQEACTRGVEAVARALEAIEAFDGSDESKREVERRYARVVNIRKDAGRNIEAAKIIEMANHSGVYAFAKGIRNLKRSVTEDEEKLEAIKSACYHHHTLYVSTGKAIERLIPPVEAARDAARDRSRMEKQPVGV
jgi:hypothetical protein